MNRTSIVATLVVASALARAANTQGEPKRPTRYSRPVDADTIVRCALAASPDIREARDRLAAVAGRRATAGLWLPSNPTAGATIALRRRPPPDAVSVLNWSVVLSQEIEIAGQRGVRVDTADAEAAAQARRVGVAEQEIAAGALTAYYEAIAADESLQFAADLAHNGQALANFAEARAKEALLAGVEADVARAEATRISLVRFEAERRLADSRATLRISGAAEPKLLSQPWNGEVDERA